MSDELERVKQQLNMARVNVDDALRQLSIVTADLDTLQERTDELLKRLRLLNAWFSTIIVITLQWLRQRSKHGIIMKRL